MGLMIIGKKDGSSVDAYDFKHKVKATKRLMEEICEDVESMEDEYGDGYRERDNYRGERSRYRYEDEPEYRHRRY